MSNTKAFTYSIKPNSTATDELGEVHQSSPTWVLTFVRWEYRDTLRTPVSDPDTIRPPLVVENDCIDLRVTDSKGILTPSMEATLVMTDVNYETSVAPGDFVFVNMLNWEPDARRVADQARDGKPINGLKDGFKGFFKIQGVRKNVVVDPNTGVKTLRFKINGFAFTEFNNSIYFNPNLINQKNLENQALYITDISTAWASYINQSGKPPIQEVIAFLIQNFIGSGSNPGSSTINGLLVSPNVHFLVPTFVGKLLGITNSTTNYKTVIAAKDIYSYIFGVQQYSQNNPNATLASGMNPSNLSPNQPRPGFQYTDTYCPGLSLLKPEYWNCVKVWSILNQYTNAPLNELYTCFRVNSKGFVMPTMVFRQIPFTNEDFTTQQLGTQDSNASTIHTTRFLTLPRWKVDSAFVLSTDLGREEAARINFVQFYAKSNFSDKGVEIAAETASKNYIFDADDIGRSGLRPYVISNQFEDLPENLGLAAPIWARILGDFLIGGHLKLNGTLNCIGMVEPIAVGDNVEFDNVVYHLEMINHVCNIDQNGNKSFRTVLGLSNGISVNSSNTGTEYSEMAYGDGKSRRIYDYDNDQILPGVAESQDVEYRHGNLDVPLSPPTSFGQPSLVKNTPKKGE